FDDVAFSPRNMGLSENEVKTRVENCLLKVGATNMEQRSASHLSLWQKKRVAIATVLAMDAQLLAFDEPTSSLDPRARREMIELLKHLGGTQFIITHDFDLALQLCPRALLLSQGRIVADDVTERLISSK